MGYIVWHCNDRELDFNGHSIISVSFIPDLDYHSYVVYIINPGTVSKEPGLSQYNILAIELVSCDKEVVINFYPSNRDGDISTQAFGRLSGDLRLLITSKLLQLGPSEAP